MRGTQVGGTGEGDRWGGQVGETGGGGQVGGTGEGDRWGDDEGDRGRTGEGDR